MVLAAEVGSKGGGEEPELVGFGVGGSDAVRPMDGSSPLLALPLALALTYSANLEAKARKKKYIVFFSKKCFFLKNK